MTLREMDTAKDDPRGSQSQAPSDTHFFQDPKLFHRPDEELTFPQQMGSGRRDARVVCETFSSGRSFANGARLKTRQSEPDKNLKANLRHKSLAYSRNPLLACFVGESVFSSRSIHLGPNCDSSGVSQRTTFSLVPVDRSTVNERTGEPQSPQLSCIGQVKHRQVKIRKSEALTADLARMHMDDGFTRHVVPFGKTGSRGERQREAAFQVQKPESFKLQKEESFKLQTVESFKLRKEELFKLQKEESVELQKVKSLKNSGKDEFFKLQKEVSFRLQRQEMPFRAIVDDIPYLDLAADELSNRDPSGNNVARLMRCRRSGDDVERIRDDEKINFPSKRNSIRHLNYFLKQKLGASLVKGGLCGWSTNEDSPRSGCSEPTTEPYEIDLSRFASGDLQAKTPSFRDLRNYPHITGKKLADIGVPSQQDERRDRRLWRDAMQDKQENDITVTEEEMDSSTVIKCSSTTVILQPATEAALWKRRCVRGDMGPAASDFDV